LQQHGQLEETTNGAEKQSYSLLQVTRLQTHADLAGLEVVQLVKKTCKEASLFCSCTVGVKDDSSYSLWVDEW